MMKVGDSTFNSNNDTGTRKACVCGPGQGKNPTKLGGQHPATYELYAEVETEGYLFRR